MEQSENYIGFPPLPAPEDIVDALVNDPPQVRWRVVRDLFRIKEPEQKQDLIERLNPKLFEVSDFRINYRIRLALYALHYSIEDNTYSLVRGKGVLTKSEIVELEPDGGPGRTGRGVPTLHPVVDFHIHPKSPDLKFMSDLRKAGVTHAVILATDTDPEDVERQEVQVELRRAYGGCALSAQVPFERWLRHAKASLYSFTHVTNQDVADWVADYPDILMGFGSVNLSRDRDYVEQGLASVERLGLKGIKLLPHSQFFFPSDQEGRANENAALMFEFCRRNGWVVLSHSGCGPGPFELPELSRASHPTLWEPLVRLFPEVPLVLAHAGAYSKEIPGIWLQEALQLGAKHRNVYLDLAAVDWLLDREMVVQKIRKTIGFDRVLFATDYPMPLHNGVSLAALVGKLKANLHMSDKEKLEVLGLNAARLLGLK